MKKRYLIITLALCLAFVVGACGGSGEPNATPSPGTTAGATATPDQSPVAEHSDEYVYRMLAFPDSLDPLYYGTGTAALPILSQIYDGLIWQYRGNPKDIRGMIAESWIKSEDGMTYTFKIREGIKFHNGEDLKLSDIVYSYYRWKDAPTSAQNASIFVSCEANEADNTVTIVLNTPSPTAILTFGTIAIVDEDVLGAETYDPTLNVANNADLVVGTSAYHITNWVQDDEIVLESVGADWYANDIYLGGNEAQIKKLVFKNIPDNNAAMIAFENNEINSIAATMAEDIEAAIAAEEEAKANGEMADVHVGFADSAIRLGVAFNMNDPVVGAQGGTAEEQEKALNLRRAISSAIDREAVNLAVYGGYGDDTVTQLTNPYTEGYSENVEFYGYDIDKAKEYLAAAGYEDGLTLKFLYISEDEYSTSLSVVVQDALRAIGITVDLEGYDQGTWFNKVYELKDYQMAYNSYEPTYTTPDVAYRSPWYSNNYWNPWGYANPEVDALIDQAQMEIDDEKRIALYTQVNEITAASLAFLPLVGARTVSLNNGNWAGFFTEGVATTTRYFMVFWDEDGYWSAEDGLPWE